MHGDELFELIPSTLGRVASGMVAALSSIRHIHVTGRVRAMFMLFDVVRCPAGSRGLACPVRRGAGGGAAPTSTTRTCRNSYLYSLAYFRFRVIVQFSFTTRAPRRYTLTVRSSMSMR